MARSAWETLAEALGIKTEMNWDAVNKRRQMQQHGTMDRRNRGPGTVLKTPQQLQRIAQRGSRGPVNPNAMAQIPAGSDVPGGAGPQANPLFAPPPRPKSPLSTPPNSPLSLGGGRDEEDEGMGY